MMTCFSLDSEEVIVRIEFWLLGSGSVGTISSAISRGTVGRYPQQIPSNISRGMHFL
jgi:hypothetical protein